MSNEILVSFQWDTVLLLSFYSPFFSVNRSSTLFRVIFYSVFCLSSLTRPFTFSVFVRYNLGAAVPVELQENMCVAELKELIARQHGVSPEVLRILFAGRELRSEVTLQVG